MAHYHCTINAGPKGAGAEHAAYIERSGRFTPERYGEIGEHETGNLPAWAEDSAVKFFAAADAHERANGTAYREFELALPKELTETQWAGLVRGFVAQELGERHAFSWAIHEPRGHNPHVHIMFSERTRDGIERGEEQYFRRANSKSPERGGVRSPTSTAEARRSPSGKRRSKRCANAGRWRRTRRSSTRGTRHGSITAASPPRGSSIASPGGTGGRR